MKNNIDYDKLFDTILEKRESIASKVSKSYDEITGRSNTSRVENMQGLKQLSEHKKKLTLALEDLDSDADYESLKSTALLLAAYLRTGYLLLGKQR